MTSPAALGPVLIGSYTTRLPHVNGRGPGLSICHFDPESGELHVISTSPATDASYLLSVEDGFLLYVAEERFEYRGQPTGSVASYRAVDDWYRLELFNRIASGGTGPVYLEMSPDGRFLLVANFWGSSVSVLPVEPDGTLREPCQILSFSGSGRNLDRQKQAHPHSLMFDAVSDLLYISDLGTDSITGYSFRVVDGFVGKPVSSLSVTPGAGPRHMRMHPDGEHLFVINELEPSVSVYRRHGQSFEVSDSVHIAPRGSPRDAIASELVIHPDGELVYAAVRGSNTIASLAFDAKAERLELLGHFETAGATPRHMALDPSGSFLIVGNQDSGSATSFRVLVETGELDRMSTFPHPSPAFIRWIGVPR